MSTFLVVGNYLKGFLSTYFSSTWYTHYMNSYLQILSISAPITCMCSYMFSCMFSLRASHVDKSEDLPVYVAQDWMSHQPLNTDPMSCMWIGHFSRLWQLGGRRIAARPGRQLLLPLALPSNTGALCCIHLSLECQHLCIAVALTSLALCVFLSSYSPWPSTPPPPPPCLYACTLRPWGTVCLSVAHLHLSFVYVSHRLYFRQESLQGYKLHCCGVTTSLYSKHHATFPHPQTLSHNSSSYVMYVYIQIDLLYK